jgi:hypothetical protein
MVVIHAPNTQVVHATSLGQSNQTSQQVDHQSGQTLPRAGSWVTTQSAEKQEYQERVPVRLLFKNELLKERGQTHLKSHLIMALKYLTVNQFVAEVCQAMEVN